MGLNVNLCRMIGAPYELECPECHKEFCTYFEDYDIECGDPNPEPTCWRLATCCPHCETEYLWNVKLVNHVGIVVRRT